MIVAISQPEHFPYLGFFQKMVNADVFVLLDDVKCQGKGSFQVRNWFVNTQGHQEWFTLHTSKHAHKQRICDVKLVDGVSWRRSYREKLRQNMDFDVQGWLDTDSLLDVNLRAIEFARQSFRITTPMYRSSELDVSGEKSALVANICRALDATVYLSGPGALSYLDPTCFGEITIEAFHPDVPSMQTFLAHRFQRHP